MAAKPYQGPHPALTDLAKAREWVEALQAHVSLIAGTFGRLYRAPHWRKVPGVEVAHELVSRLAWLVDSLAGCLGRVERILLGEDALRGADPPPRGPSKGDQ